MTTTIAEQQGIADEILVLLTRLDPNVVIAGGAPRDWMLGNLAADLDIYIYIPGSTSFRQTALMNPEFKGFFRKGPKKSRTKPAHKTASAEGIGTNDLPDYSGKSPYFGGHVEGFQTLSPLLSHGISSYYGGMEGILDVFDLTFQGHKCQIICLDRVYAPREIVAKFPVTISQAWYKDGKVSSTNAFKDSIEHKIIGYDTRSWRERRYLDKIMGKFNGYHFVLNHQFEREIADKVGYL